jgi:hypothetical protein
MLERVHKNTKKAASKKRLEQKENISRHTTTKIRKTSENIANLKNETLTPV